MGTLVIFALAIFGIYSYGEKKAHDKQVQYDTHIKAMEDAVISEDFEKGLKEAGFALEIKKEEPTLLAYQTQLKAVLDYQALIETGDLEKVKLALTEIKKLPKLMEALTSFINTQENEIEKTENDLAEADNKLLKAQNLSEKKEYEASNKEIMNLTNASDSKFMTQKVEEVIKIQAKNNQEIAKIEKAKQEKLEEERKYASLNLTDDEAKKILIKNLPDNFTDFDKKWLMVENDRGTGIRFTVTGNTSERSNVYVDVIDENEVTVTYEKGSSYNAEIDTQSYTFKRIN